MDNKNAKQKKKSPFGGILALIILLSMTSEIWESLLDNRSIRLFVRRIQSWLFFHGVNPPLLDYVPWILLVLVIVLVIAVVKAIIKGSKAAAEDKPPVASRPAAAKPAAAHRDPRSASFVKPDAHCVSCELSGDDHFARDRAQRIAQLDEWLKNGLIEKDEYRILKRRYMQE